MAEDKTDKGHRSSPYRLFKVFFRIGLFTLGGGYGMIPIIESDVVDKNRWINREEFIDLLAVAQSCPGVFAMNISTFIGYKLHKIPGAVLAALGAALPSFLIILAIAAFFHQINDVEWVAACFNGIRPAVVALIAAPTFSLAKSAGVTLANCWIPAASALLIWLLGVNPIYIILAAGAGGYAYGMLSEDDKGEKDIK
ncbi:chromate transporter [Prevotella sp. PINT]|uniref:chromate transporter n=1 Tax=Palleniella intestinalis TaxID=2736291 RepID=UPI001557CAC9|nr:chromate transporter [Palleniella intestinalis]NPD81931.1 chromate transporter [Palleniella intestinalis]